MKKFFPLFLCSSLIQGCFMFEEPFHPYGIAFRNACNYDVESTIPSISKYNYQEYLPEAYLNSEGIPVINLKPEAETILLFGIARADYGKMRIFGKNFLQRTKHLQ
jgi:hypothetical protein